MKLSSVKHLAVHHSATPRDQEASKALSSIDTNHKERLHPEANGFGKHIAYHFVIDGKGIVHETRPLDEVGYHAGVLDVNKHSIGICLLGDFTKERPSEGQMEALKEILARMILFFDLKPKDVKPHRGIKSTVCPGTNLTNEMIVNLLEPSPDWGKIYEDKLIKAGVVKGEADLDATMTRKEIYKVIIESIKRLNQENCR